MHVIFEYQIHQFVCMCIIYTDTYVSVLFASRFGHCKEIASTKAKLCKNQYINGNFVCFDDWPEMLTFSELHIFCHFIPPSRSQDPNTSWLTWIQMNPTEGPQPPKSHENWDLHLGGQSIGGNDMEDCFPRNTLQGTRKHIPPNAKARKSLTQKRLGRGPRITGIIGKLNL